MKSLYCLILILAISKIGLSQFSPIWNINNNFSQFEVRAFEMNGSGEMLLLTDQYDGGPTSDVMAYTSLDNGQTWDSTLFHDFYMMRDNAVVTEGGKMYFASIQNVFPTQTTPGYQRKVFHSSLDGGASWEVKTIDSIFGANFERSLSFINDSTGMFFYNGGKYLTTDYGDSWLKISSSGAQHLGVLDDRFILYHYNSVETVNPLNLIVDSFDYDPFSVGRVRQSSIFNYEVFRGIRSQDGNLFGPEYNHNFAALNIDQLPLGDQRVIHFPQRYALVDIESTNNCVHVVLDGIYVKSCDNFNTFHDVDAFNGNMNEQLFYLDFVDDSLGYAISKNLITYEWHLWETTNGGGQNLQEVMTIHSEVGVDEMVDEFDVNVYPNPVNELLTIEADKTIERVELYSMLGEVILANEFHSNSIHLDVSTIAAGNYLIRVVTDRGARYSNVVVE